MGEVGPLEQKKLDIAAVFAGATVVEALVETQNGGKSTYIGGDIESSIMRGVLPNIMEGERITLSTQDGVEQSFEF